MQIGAAGVAKLADMICGNAPFDYFPYRSSSYLTRFFVDLDLDYVHDGSTRNAWVSEVLRQLNSRPSKQQNMPSTELIKVIEYLLHPDHYLFNEKLDRPKAIETVKTCLKT